MDAEIEKQLEAQKRVLLEFHTAYYERATNYTNLIMVAGYAAYFAMWSNVSALLTPFQQRLSALAMIISVLIFVFWEVYKMVAVSVNLRNLAKVTETALEEFEREFNGFVDSERRIHASTSRVWPIVLITTVPTAIFAIVVLVYAFASKLLGF